MNAASSPALSGIRRSLPSIIARSATRPSPPIPPRAWAIRGNGATKTAPSTARLPSKIRVRAQARSLKKEKPSVEVHGWLFLIFDRFNCLLRVMRPRHCKRCQIQRDVAHRTVVPVNNEIVCGACHRIERQGAGQGSKGKIVVIACNRRQMRHGTAREYAED